MKNKQTKSIQCFLTQNKKNQTTLNRKFRVSTMENIATDDENFTTQTRKRK